MPASPASARSGDRWHAAARSSGTPRRIRRSRRPLRPRRRSGGAGAWSGQGHPGRRYLPRVEDRQPVSPRSRAHRPRGTSEDRRWLPRDPGARHRCTNDPRARDWSLAHRVRRRRRPPRHPGRSRSKLARYEQLARTATMLEIETLRILVASLDDIIRSKEIAGRPRTTRRSASSAPSGWVVRDRRDCRGRQTGPRRGAPSSGGRLGTSWRAPLESAWSVCLSLVRVSMAGACLLVRAEMEPPGRDVPVDLVRNRVERSDGKEGRQGPTEAAPKGRPSGSRSRRGHADESAGRAVVGSAGSHRRGVVLLSVLFRIRSRRRYLNHRSSRPGDTGVAFVDQGKSPRAGLRRPRRRARRRAARQRSCPRSYAVVDSSGIPGSCADSTGGPNTRTSLLLPAPPRRIRGLGPSPEATMHVGCPGSAMGMNSQA